MATSLLRLLRLLSPIAATLSLMCAGNALAQGSDAALATNGKVKVTASDFDASILRIPE